MLHEQQTKKKSSFNVVIIEGGRAVASFLPEHKGTAALVDLLVLQRIISHLPESSFAVVKDSFIDKILGAKDVGAYCAVIEQELAFQTTVNNISTVDMEDVVSSIHTAEDLFQASVD